MNNFMKNFNVFVYLTILLLQISGEVYAQKISQQEKSTIDEAVITELKKENTVVFSRKTIENSLSSCDLEYKYAYRDFNAKRGSPVFVQGAVSIFYNKGQSPGVLFKVAPALGDVSTGKWGIVYPPYAELFVKKLSLKKYQASDFVCENNGKCIAYVDRDVSLLMQIFNKESLDMTIKFSLAKGGNDSTFTFKELVSNQQFLFIQNNFNACGLELVDKIINDLSGTQKK
jgi:hypothetical protein